MFLPSKWYGVESKFSECLFEFFFSSSLVPDLVSLSAEFNTRGATVR